MSGPPRARVHSVYADGTRVWDGQQPKRLPAYDQSFDPAAHGRPHSMLRWDTVNQRVYQAREYGPSNTPLRDIDFTNPTFPSGAMRPGHPGPPHQHLWQYVRPNNPAAGYYRDRQPIPFPYEQKPMRTQGISVVSIHPDPARPLALDLKEILEKLVPFLPAWTWCVKDLDWLGNAESEALCRAVEAAGSQGLWISSEDLLRHSRMVYQTIEGEFLAFPRALNPSPIAEENLSVGAFPSSEAELGLRAIDGCFFEVYVKKDEFLQPLRDLEGVHEENPNRYFEEP